MKKVYTHENRLLVFNAKNLLEERGIACVIKNEFACGGIGELAPFETWPELWVVEEQDEALAEQVLQALSREPAQDIACRHCAAENAANFHICWQCGQPLDSAE
jgi:hypothetical protein